MMKIKTETDLRAAILQLERIQSDEKILMKEQFLVAVESIKPVNLIKSTLMEVAGSEAVHVNLINSAIGLTLGYLSKSLFQNLSKSPLKKVFGTVLLLGVKNLVTRNPEIVESIGSGIFTAVKKIIANTNKQTDSDQIQ